MSNKAALNPRFSVKASFDGNIIDVSDDQYATEKARNYPKNSGRCSVNQAQPTIEVQAPRRLQELGVPSEEDRRYWGTKTVVYQPRKNADVGKVTNTPVQPQRQVRAAAPQCRRPVQAKVVNRNQKVAAPAANPDNHVWGKQMGQKQVQLQKAQREARRGGNVVAQDAKSLSQWFPVNSSRETASSWRCRRVSGARRSFVPTSLSCKPILSLIRRLTKKCRPNKTLSIGNTGAEKRLSSNRLPRRLLNAALRFAR